MKIHLPTPSLQSEGVDEAENKNKIITIMIFCHKIAAL